MNLGRIEKEFKSNSHDLKLTPPNTNFVIFKVVGVGLVVSLEIHGGTYLSHTHIVWNFKYT